ncbi:MAG: hypothetical protein PHN44_00030 [Candidatus Marinimicrobia bacterium]|nr:hypothetical protein [Candidatus Neomarinimicrobiota bacterium]
MHATLFVDNYNILTKDNFVDARAWHNGDVGRLEVRYCFLQLCFAQGKILD